MSYLSREVPAEYENHWPSSENIWTGSGVSEGREGRAMEAAKLFVVYIYVYIYISQLGGFQFGWFRSSRVNKEME